MSIDEIRAKTMEIWQPIENAPKDGTLIKLCWWDDGPNDVSHMRWGHIQRNGLFPGDVGMWICPKSGFTWHDFGDGGPTHWMPITVSPIPHHPRSPERRK